MKKSIHEGDFVTLSRHASIPLRYRGRTATVVDMFRSKRGGKRALVDFPGRRVNPLEIAANQLTLSVE